MDVGSRGGLSGTQQTELRPRLPTQVWGQSRGEFLQRVVVERRREGSNELAKQCLAELVAHVAAARSGAFRALSLTPTAATR